MSFTITQIKEHLVGLSHGGTLNKVRNIEALFERAAAIFSLKLRVLETVRTVALANTIHDDVFNYSLPSDFGALIDLIPQDNRTSWDMAFRTPAGQFDLEKAHRNRTVSIEGSEGSKIIRINWKTRAAKVLHSMDSVTANGTWSAVATASGVVADEITKRKGAASIRFDVAATGDGIDNDDMTALNFTEEDEVADVYFDLYIKNSTDLANFNSITAIWGNNLSSAYWTGTAQTLRADGSALRVGWNEIKVPWSTAVETGTVSPSTIDSLKFTVNIDAAISDLRIDNVRFSIGRNFEIKYYSKFLFRNPAGTWISKTSSDDDEVMIDNDSLPHFLMECVKAMAHQVEGEDSVFDIEFVKQELKELFPFYTGLYPSMIKKAVGRYGGLPIRRRW